METINFTKLIGKEVLGIITMLDPILLQRFIVRGVEGGGVWVECQALTNLVLEKLGLSSAPRTPIFFLSFQELKFVHYSEDVPALSEKALGI